MDENKMRELLAEAEQALRAVGKAAITVAPRLCKPYDDAPDRIASAIRETVPLHQGGYKTADAVLAVVGPELERLRTELAEAREQTRVVRRVGEDETARAAYETMDAERRSWESRRAVDNVVLADLRRELAALKADAIPVARALLAYQLAVATTGIRKDAPVIGDREAALRITVLDTPEETIDGR